MPLRSSQGRPGPRSRSSGGSSFPKASAAKATSHKGSNAPASSSKCLTHRTKPSAGSSRATERVRPSARRDCRLCELRSAGSLVTLREPGPAPEHPIHDAEEPGAASATQSRQPRRPLRRVSRVSACRRRTTPPGCRIRRRAPSRLCALPGSQFPVFAVRRAWTHLDDRRRSVVGVTSKVSGGP